MLKKLVILNLIALIYIFGFLLPIPSFADSTTTCTSFIKWYDGHMYDVAYVWSDNDLQLQATFATSTSVVFPSTIPAGIEPYKQVCVTTDSSVQNSSSTAETAYMIVSFSQLYFIFLTIILLIAWLVVAMYRKK